MFPLTYSASASCSSYLIRIFITIVFFLGSNFFQFATTSEGYDSCADAMNGQFSCENGPSLRYPFWRFDEKEQQQRQYYCGYPGFGITCNPINKYPMINISDHSYSVIQSYNSHENEITIVDPYFIEKTETDHQYFIEKSCRRPYHNFSHSVFLKEVEDSNRQLTFFFCCNSPPPQISRTGITSSNQFPHIKCLDCNDTMRSYVFVDLDLERERIHQNLLAHWNQNHCIHESVNVPVAEVDEAMGLMETLERGFRVRWATPIECQMCERTFGYCSYLEKETTYTCRCREGLQFRHSADRNESYCSWDNDTFRAHTSMHNKILIIGICSGFGGLAFMMVLFLYRNNQRKRIGSIAKNVELFLESYGYRSLQRYKYKDIKKMTNSFKDKLGQGGYGSVYKGKLVDGRLVAVKVLINDPKKSTNGEDFMNEVATIGRTNHVNIVALLGFCSSGSKRALVYEFMTNGSLEKFIYAEKEKDTITSTSSTEVNSTSSTDVHVLGLGWEKLYQIAVGIARGLEYLHRGCNTGRILHFDIKPHNILLDENFCPKISDFGLAKLCPTRESIVSMLSGGRGTIGYIAPEVYNRNFGRVSYKSDVYSYGMMVLEMVGGRKNIDPFVENTSEIYFPHWIYNHFENDQDRIQDLFKFEEAFDEETAKKMIMVGLWCIQTHQESRPSMGKVAEMLEGSIKDLQMPPNPFVDPSLHPQG